MSQKEPKQVLLLAYGEASLLINRFSGSTSARKWKKNPCYPIIRIWGKSRLEPLLAYKESPNQLKSSAQILYFAWMQGSYKLIFLKLKVFEVKGVILLNCVFWDAVKVCVNCYISN